MFFFSLFAGTNRCAEQSLDSCSSMVGNLAIRDPVGTTPSRDPDVWYVHIRSLIVSSLQPPHGAAAASSF